MRKLAYIGAVLVAVQTLPAMADKTALSTVNSFEKLFGVTEGERRNHSKGFCFTGTLQPMDKRMALYSTSPLFKYESQVIGRLSHKGGNFHAADNKPAEYGMGLSIKPATGKPHMMSMNTLDFFPVSTPEAFAELMKAKAEGKAAVKAFKESSKELQNFKAHNATKTKTLTPYEGTQFNSINSFYLENDLGKKTAIRWSFKPVNEQGVVLEPTHNFFYQNMQKNLAAGEISWDMVITLANKEDAIDNAAIPWKGDHTQIIGARLKVTAISHQEAGTCKNLNFDPLVLSDGFHPSNDPLLQARRNAYAISFGRRLSEQ